MARVRWRELRFGRQGGGLLRVVIDRVALSEAQWRGVNPTRLLPIGGWLGFVVEYFVSHAPVAPKVAGC